MDVLCDFMLLSFRNKIKDGHHDVIIADFSKWFNMFEILYNQSYWCAYQTFCFFILRIVTKLNGDFAIGINVFICFTSFLWTFETFEMFDSKLLKYLQKACPSRTLAGSLWDLSFFYSSNASFSFFFSFGILFIKKTLIWPKNQFKKKRNLIYTDENILAKYQNTSAIIKSESRYLCRV